MSNSAEFADITPTPRILAMLGEIPFQSWQCLAELIDNSLDALNKSKIDADDVAEDMAERSVIVNWSADEVGRDHRTLEVQDTGPGMDLDTLRNCVRAGYSTNDPLGNLGLFGMGFNIATARLGDKTIVSTTRVGDAEWIGLEIDFERLTKTGTFHAPVVREVKPDPSVSGTRVVVSKLKPAIMSELMSQRASIRKVLEQIYTTILEAGEVEILIQGQKLNPRPHCTWSRDRHSTYKSRRVNAVIEFDEVLGEALFDTNRFRYLTQYEEADERSKQRQTGSFSDGVVKRERRIHGWVGVQRYADTSDFGLDFIRNGRKIIRRDKTLFSYRNAVSDSEKMEYPQELGSTIGGRLVGEIHVDHLHPNYQKTDFERYDNYWQEIVGFLRGEGPVLPNDRKAMGYDDLNDRPLALLMRAFNNVRKGTRYWMIDNNTAKRWSERFHAGDNEYLTDDKWVEAAREFDRERADDNPSGTAAPNPGTSPSDDVDEFAPEGGGEESTGEETPAPAATAQPSPTQRPVNTREERLADLNARSRAIASLSQSYVYSQSCSPVAVEAREVTTGVLTKNAEEVPTLMEMDGVRAHFYCNPKHRFFQEYSITPAEVLMIDLANRFRHRDALERDVGELYTSLVNTYCRELKIDVISIQETARDYFGRLRESAIELLAGRAEDVVNFIHESSGDVEDIVIKLNADGSPLRQPFIKKSPRALPALAEAPARTLIRLVERFPEAFFDEKFFTIAYETLSLPDERMTERVRNEGKDRVISYLKDALWVSGDHSCSTRASASAKQELQRCSHSLALLISKTMNF